MEGIIPGDAQGIGSLASSASRILLTEGENMTDREMLLIAYGAMKVVIATVPDSFEYIVTQIEEHLYPPKINNQVSEKPDYLKPLGDV